jgi:hypothetical protein
VNKRDLALLERIFAADIDQAINNKPRMPVQIGGKRIEELERQGYVQRVEVMLGGRFPVTVKGWDLTSLGHITYCMSCDDTEDEL